MYSLGWLPGTITYKFEGVALNSEPSGVVIHIMEELIVARSRKRGAPIVQGTDLIDVMEVAQLWANLHGDWVVLMKGSKVEAEIVPSGWQCDVCGSRKAGQLEPTCIRCSVTAYIVSIHN